ncbi:MAG: hypothetical protein JSU74_02780 [Candidatus Zixiibacteriota bacterium]|nr:MAG: hypothetical protein JSU74_02780 [candidate division Zixibacteria bacterium]
MTKLAIHILAALLILTLVPIVPKMIAIRTRVLYALRLRRLAAWHDRHAVQLVTVVRVTIAVIAAIITILGFCGR